MKKFFGFLKVLILGLLIGVTLTVVVMNFCPSLLKKGVVQSKNHDVTLENKGITLVVADFSKPILGKAIKRSSLIVLDQPVSTKSTVNDMKFENMGILKNINIFDKSQDIEYNGTGEYTVELNQLTSDNVTLDKKEKKVILKVPHPVLSNVIVDPEKTRVMDINRNTIFAIGEVKQNPDSYKSLEEEAKEKMKTALDTDDIKKKADDNAKNAILKLLQPTITSVSPEYKLDIQFL
jgi:hypothetical protein